MNNPLPELQVGDHLLYAPSSPVGYIITLKTWDPTSHIEVYAGNGQSFASRGEKSKNVVGDMVKGVDVYPLRISELSMILRPKKPINFKKGEDWFYSVARGQGYDYKGLLCFTLAVRDGAQDKMFCSEFATRFDRECGFDAIHPEWDADKVAPMNFKMLPVFDRIWEKK